MPIKIPATDSIGKTSNALLTHFNVSIIAAVRDKQPPKLRTWAALMGEDSFCWADEPLKITTDHRVWTRGDGSRYKELNTFKVRDFKRLSKVLKYTKRVFKSDADIYAFCWNEIITSKNAKRLGTLSSEFGSSESHEIYRVGKMVFINRPWGIDHASVSILKNTWVWRLTK